MAVLTKKEALEILSQRLESCNKILAKSTESDVETRAIYYTLKYDYIRLQDYIESIGKGVLIESPIITKRLKTKQAELERIYNIIICTLQKHPTGLAPRKLRPMVGKVFNTDFNSKTFHAYLQNLCSLGKLEKGTRGHYITTVKRGMVHE